MFWKAALRAPLAFLAFAAAAHAQLPVARLDAVSPMGAQIGRSAEVGIAGAELEGATLHFSHPGITATPGEANRFQLTVAADVPPGTYDAWVTGDWGASLPRAFQIGAFPVATVPGEAKGADKAVALTPGTVWDGVAEAGAAHHFRIDAKAGQRFFVEMSAARLGSRTDGSLVLLDPSGEELARSLESAHGDPLLDHTPAADGALTLRVSDRLARGGTGYGYRLRLSEGPHIDYVLPASAPPGTRTTLQVFGRNLPDGTPAGDGLERIEMEVDVPSEGRPRSSALNGPAAAGLRGFEFRLGEGAAASNAVFVAHADAPSTIDAADNAAPDSAQALTVPCEVSGRFSPGSTDHFTFAAAAGTAYIVEALSHRFGAPSDPVLTVLKLGADGSATPLGSSDDDGANIGGRAYRTDHRDAAVRFTADADFTARVELRDQFGTRAGYRLQVRTAQPRFDLIAAPAPNPAVDNQGGKRVERAGLTLRRGEVGIVQVYALRRDGFAGEIALKAEGLPGAPISGKIPAGESSCLFAIASPGAAEPFDAALRIFGSAEIGGARVEKEAVPAAAGWTVGDADQEAVQARLGQAFPLAAIADPAPLAIAREGDATAPIQTSLGAKLEIPFTLTKTGEIKDKITVNAGGLAGTGNKAPQVQVEKDQAGGTLAFELRNDRDNNRFRAGTFELHLTAKSKVGYRRYVAEAEAAEKAKADAAAAAEARRKERDAAKAALDEAREATAETEEAKAHRVAAAEEALKAAAAAATAAEEARKAAEAAANGANERAKPQDRQFANHSPPITIEIEPAPVRIQLGPVPAAAPGSAIELPVEIERRYGFAEGLTLAAALPDGSGLTAPDVPVAKDAATGALAITVAADAAPGERRFEVVAKMKWNGMDLERRAAAVLQVAAETAPDPPAAAPAPEAPAPAAAP